MYVCVHLCVCMIHVFFNFGSNVSINFFSFIWNSVPSLVWYMVINIKYLNNIRIGVSIHLNFLGFFFILLL